jgi:PAS domain S-box-containing protein
MNQSHRRTVLDPAVLFRRVFDQRFQFMAVLDSVGVVLEVNNAPLRRGMTREQFVGHHIGETPFFSADPAWVLTWNTRLAEAAQRREAVAYEDVTTGPQGETRSADAVLTPVFGDDERLEYFIIEAEDTTERIQVELALRESERRFHDFAESLPVMAWSTDAAGCCDYLNRRWLDYTGAAPGQHHGWSWIDAIHPEDRPGFADRWTTSQRDATPLETEYRVRRHDGEYRWFDMRLVPVFGQEQQVTRWYGAASDIHEAHELRRELAAREAQLSAALIAGNMARFAYDLEHRRFTSDPFLSDLIRLPTDSFSSAAGIAGYSQHVHPDDRAEWQRVMSRAFDPATPDFVTEYRLLDDDGVGQWIGSRGRVEFDDHGKPRTISGVVFALPDGEPERASAPHLEPRTDPRD